jgi:hypothetical protein
MEIITRNPVWTDSDYYLYASGRRRRTGIRKKKRYGLNKAIGYHPTVAAVRYFKDRSDENKRLDRQAAVNERRRQEGGRPPRRNERQVTGGGRPPRRSERQVTGSESPSPRRSRPAPKRRPVLPRGARRTSATPPRPENRPPRPPRPEGKPNTQPVDKPAETTQSFLKNKAVIIGIGVLVVGVIGYFIFKSSKANK